MTIRLIDPPLLEFLPDRIELAVRPAPHDRELFAAVERMHEQNPMLGLRGVRLGLAVPGLMAMQVQAIAEAAVERLRDGGTPRAEIMIPLVGTVGELRLARSEAELVLGAVETDTVLTLGCPIGTMIELPRAPRSPPDASPRRPTSSPSAPTTSPRPPGGLSRDVNPRLDTGPCWEHGGDPDSIRFFHRVGLDYVSCSPFRIPAARLEAGRAALMDTTGISDSR